jgi:prephenate dehydratase/chorismate mutase/prephenate dehydratase
MTSVAFQGELGAFSEEAVRRFFGEEVEPIPQRDFAGVGRAVMSGEVEAGVLPIENTLAGSVVGSYDVLACNDVVVIGEVITPIHHCVLGVPGARLERLTRVLSHPVALAQCTRFLQARHGMEAVAFYDTAGAAREIAANGDPAVGAIAGQRAAERYGLEVLAADVEDRNDNQTRFLVIARSGGMHLSRLVADNQGAKKTTLLVDTPNTPGALVRILSPFAERGINLSKLESRPAGEPWTYRFFIELDADALSTPAREALAEVRGYAPNLRVLGSYPRSTGSNQ